MAVSTAAVDSVPSLPPSSFKRLFPAIVSPARIRVSSAFLPLPFLIINQPAGRDRGTSDAIQDLKPAIIVGSSSQMDDGGISRNWGGYYDHRQPAAKNPGLNLMNNLAPGEGDSKSLPPNGNFPQYNNWIRPRESNPRFLQVPPNYPIMSDPQPLQIHNPPESAPISAESPKEAPQSKKRSQAGRGVGASKPKKPKNSPHPRESTNSRTKNSRLPSGIVINGVPLDISGLPTPVCSCTGSPQQCYRWGIGGWQSACCTNTVSLYPLPMSSKRRGARIPGRKMSQGAFKKVLEKLTGEGFDLSTPIDLNGHWAKHGTNKYVTIR